MVLREMAEAESDYGEGNSMTILATLLLSVIPHDLHLAAETLDVCESNDVWRPDWSELQFAQSQWIWRRNSEVLGWQWDKDCIVSYHPNRVLVSDGRRVRVLRPLGIIGTHSNYDRENCEREWLPETRRKGLAR